ncbi:MAG: PQQ-binding-like beta-propeller repeat protein [Pirellulaceae bacterium]|nr:PQQ-binding-like beta-propeller repeat protein [Pirellulaceae bacterium]
MIRKIFRSAIVLSVMLTSASPVCLGEDWLSFLGNGGNGFAPKASLPVKFTVSAEGKSAENVAWRSPLPGRAVSGPVTVGNRIFSTSSSGIEQRWCEVTCVDSQSGIQLWTRKVKATGRPFCHPTSANAAPTPCSDGERVYAFFSSNDLVCYDLEGNLMWYRGLAYDNPKVGNDVGMSSSPVLAGGVVVVQSECQADSFAAGIDAKTGATLWQIERPRKANWSSPATLRGADGQMVVLLQSSQGLSAIDPRSGSEVWKLDEKCSSVTTTVAVNGRFYIPGSNLKAFDLPRGLEAPKLLWEAPRVSPGNSSVVVTDKAVLAVKGSVLAATDLDGKLLWQTRLGEIGSVWASPVVAGDKLYIFGMKGRCVTVDVSGSEGKIVGESELGEEVLGSPAIIGNSLVVRSVDALWKIAADK